MRNKQDIAGKILTKKNNIIKRQKKVTSKSYFVQKTSVRIQKNQTHKSQKDRENKEKKASRCLE